MVIDVIHDIGHIVHTGNTVPIGNIGTLGVFISVGENLSPTFQPNSYMDELYPSMNSYNTHVTNPVELYINLSVFLGLCILASFICIKEPKRLYRTGRKNTDDIIINS